MREREMEGWKGWEGSGGDEQKKGWETGMENGRRERGRKFFF